MIMKENIWEKGTVGLSIIANQMRVNNVVRQLMMKKYPQSILKKYKYFPLLYLTSLKCFHKVVPVRLYLLTMVYNIYFCRETEPLDQFCLDLHGSSQQCYRVYIFRTFPRSWNATDTLCSIPPLLHGDPGGKPAHFAYGFF